MSGGKLFRSAVRISLVISVVLTLVMSPTSVQAAEPEAKASAETAGTEKALKYYELLAKRPEPGYLFDRFYNTWLDESTVDSLEAFLRQRVEQSKQTGDQLLLAFFYAKKGDDVAALEEFRKALANNPASAATWFHKATIEARTLDFDTAISDLKKAREQKPDDKLAVQIDKQLGKLLAQNRQTAEALKIWQDLLAAHPDDEELYEDLVELHIDEGLFKEAAALEEKLIARTKDEYLSVTRRLRLGDIHHRAGEQKKAVEVYTAALDAVGSDSWLEREILAQVDQVFRREDDLTGLKKLYDELLKKYAKRIAIHRRYAQLLVELGDNDPALAAYREILKLTPGERTTREEYINVLAKIGKKDEAIKELQSLADQHAKDAELRYRLASFYEEAKQTDQAIAAVNKYLETSDGSEYAYLRGARLLERLDNKDAAKGVYEKMAAKFADSASAQEAYAAFLYANGKKEDAIKRWRELAKGGDLKQMLQVARTLSTRAENKAALELLKQRVDELKKEPLFLGQLVTTALALKKYDEAIPWAEARVRLADNVAELETALEQAATSIERADKLEEVARNLEKIEKRSVPESCLLAELLERLGESAKADEALKKPADAGNLLAVSEQIRLYSERREWNQAADATRHILELPEGRKSLHVRRLVELYQRDYQLEEALKWVDEWKRLSPGSTMPWVTEARMLQGLGKTEEALKVLRTAVLKFDADEDLRVRLAEFYVENDQPADALRIYWQLYEETEDLNGKLRWAQRLAELAQQEGNVQQLVQDFDERVRNNRQSIVPLLALSEVYRVTDDYEGRRRALTAAAKIKPDDMYLLQQVARVEEQDGDWQAALATLERAAALDKTNRTREQIARLYLTYGEDEKGFAILFELVNPADADPRTLETTADTLCATQEWERAADFLAGRLPDHAADYRLRYLMAVALEEAGRGEEAAQQFTQLLSDQEELPAKKQAAGAQQSQMAQMNSYFDLLRQLLPAEAYEWLQLSQSKYTAYAHRQQGMGVYMATQGGSGSGGPRSNIQLPPTVDQVRPMALVHLLTVAATLDEDKQNQVCADIEAHGFKHPKLLMRLDSQQDDFSQVLPEILEKEPDNETALAMLVMQQWGVQDETLAPYCSKAVEKFRKSRPQLAFMAAVQAGVQDAIANPAETDDEGKPKKDSPNKNLDEALQIAATFEHPNPMIVMSLTMALGGRNFGGQDLPVSDAYRQKLSELLVKWYPEMSKSPQWGGWAFYSASQSLAQNSDPTAFVHFLDDEVGRYQTGGKGRSSQNQMQMYYGGGGQTQLLTPLSFPPKQLADFPPQVLTAFSKDQSANPFGTTMARSSDQEGYADKIKPLLEGIKSPVLRVLFASSAELKDVVKQEIDKLLSAKTPQLDAYLLAASLAGESEDYAETVRLLQKCAYLPMKQEMRRQVDSAIVSAVLAAKDKSTDIDKNLLDAGQQASLRLHRAKLDAAQRSELITAMETLGLKKEAEKLDAIASATPSQSSGAVMRVTSVPQTSADRISKLVDQGKRDVAVKQLASEVQGHARQMFSNMQNSQYYRQQFREVKRRIDAHNMADEVLKQLEPGDSKNVQRITEYAMTCEVFDRKKEAQAAYEQALSIRPKDDMARTHLILMLATENPDEGAKQLGQLSKTVRTQFGQMLSDQMQDYEISFETRLGFGELAVRYLAVLDETDLQQSSWVENLMNQLGRYMYGRRGSLPSLYTPKKDREKSDQNSELMEKRQKLHAELCEQMLKTPALARTGFRHLLAATEAEGQPIDAFAARAQKILTDEAEAKPSRGGIQQTTTNYNNGQQEVRMRTPEEFLARTAWKSKDWKLIDETLLPKLVGGKNKESRERLEQMAALYRCEEPQFLEKAEAIIKQSRPIQPGQPSEGISIVVDVWADRDLKVDLQPMLLKQLKTEVNGPNHYQAPEYIVHFIDGIAKRADRKQQLAFLEEVAAIYLGPAEKRNEFVKKNYNRNNITWGTPNGRIYVYSQLMEQLCQRSDLMFAILEHLEQFDDPKPVSNFEYRIRGAIAAVQGKGVDDAMKLLSQSPWLESLENFRALAVGESDWEAPLVVLLKQDSKGSPYRKELREKLAQQQASAPTFGGGLIIATLDQDTKPNVVLDFVGGQMDAIKALPEKRQQELASLVRGLTKRDEKQQKDLSAAAIAASQWLDASHASEANAMLAKLQSAKRLEEIGIQNGQADDFMRQQLMPLIQKDTGAAVKVFFRVCELVHDAQRRGQWNMSYGDETSVDGYLLRTCGYNDPDLPVYNFLADVLLDEKGTKIETGYNVSQVCSNAINKAYNRASSATNGKSPTSEDKLRAVYAELGNTLKDRPSSLLIPSLYQRVNGDFDASTSKKALEWAKSEMQSGKYPELASDVEAILSLIANQKERGAKKDSSKERFPMADYHKRILAILTDEKLSYGWRLEVATFIAGQQSLRMPLELAKEITKLHGMAMEKEIPIVGNQNGQLTNVIVALASDESSKDLLADWREKWAKRYLRPAPPARVVRSGGTNVFSTSDARALCGALRLFLAADDDEHAKQLLHKYSDHIGQLPATISILLHANRPEEAARVLRAGWQRLAMQWPNYDAEADKNLPAMLEKLEREDEHYLAKVVVAAMHKGTKTRDERLTTLAEEFAKVEFKDPAMKKLCLVILSESAPAGTKVADAVAAAYDAKNVLVAATSGDSSKMTQETRLAKCHFRNRLREGDYAAYVDVINRMSANPSDDDYQFGNLVSPFFDCAADSLRDKKGKPWSAEESKAIGDAFCNTLKDRQYVYFNNYPAFTTIVVATHAQSGEIDAMSKWMKKLSDNSRSYLTNQGVKPEIWEYGLRLNGPATPENLNARLNYVQNVLRWAFEQKWLQRTGSPYRIRGQQDRNLFIAVVKSGLLTADELKANGLAAMEGIGPKDEPNYAKAALANWLQSNKDYETASGVWRSMINIPADAKKVARNETNYVLGLAVCLKNLKKFDEARAAMAMLEGKEIDQAMKASYEQYKGEIEAAAKAEAAKSGTKKDDSSKKTSRYKNRTEYIPKRSAA